MNREDELELIFRLYLGQSYAEVARRFNVAGETVRVRALVEARKQWLRVHGSPPPQIHWPGRGQHEPGRQGPPKAGARPTGSALPLNRTDREQITLLLIGLMSEIA